MKLARPMLSAGKTMWNETVNANWMRARSNADIAEFMDVLCVMAAKGGLRASTVVGAHCGWQMAKA